jgi:hypothetical protein
MEGTCSRSLSITKSGPSYFNASITLESLLSDFNSDVLALSITVRPDE